MGKKEVAVLFGGQSSEHEISCLSAATIIKNMDETKYNVTLIGITKEGHWLHVSSLEELEDGTWRNGTRKAVITPDATEPGLLLLDGTRVTRQKVDVFFPVLHGLYGEDGTVQGLFELSKIPYVGCGVLASAVSMDKLYTKIIVDTLGVTQAAYVPVEKRDLKDMEAVIAKIEAKLPYPVFVKPSDAGSSKGVSKACDRGELEAALKLAAAEGTRVLVEETIVGRELECAVLKEDGETKASGVGEILAAAEFYDYDAKYNNAESRTVIGPELPEGKTEEIRRDAVRIFDAVSGCGLARIDFFLENETNRVVFNELNTLPGFTSISMYPMLWGAAGIPVKELVSRLIETAFTRR